MIRGAAAPVSYKRFDLRKSRDALLAFRNSLFGYGNSISPPPEDMMMSGGRDSTTLRSIPNRNSETKQQQNGCSSGCFGSGVAGAPTSLNQQNTTFPPIRPTQTTIIQSNNADFNNEEFLTDGNGRKPTVEIRKLQVSRLTTGIAGSKQSFSSVGSQVLGQLRTTPVANHTRAVLLRLHIEVKCLKLKAEPLELDVYDNITVRDVIAKLLRMYNDEKRIPRLVNNPSLFELRYLDDEARVDYELPAFKMDRSIVDLNVSSAALCRMKGIKIDRVLDKSPSSSILPESKGDKKFIRVWMEDGKKYVLLVNQSSTLKQILVIVARKSLDESMTEATYEMFVAEDMEIAFRSMKAKAEEAATPKESRFTTTTKRKEMRTTTTSKTYSSNSNHERVVEYFTTVEELGSEEIGVRRKGQSINIVSYVPSGNVPTPTDFQLSVNSSFKSKEFLVKKYNTRGVAQDRIMLVTPTRIYNDIPNASEFSRKSTFFGTKRKYWEIESVVKVEPMAGEPKQFRVAYRDFETKKIVSYIYEAQSDLFAAEIVATIEHLRQRF